MTSYAKTRRLLREHRAQMRVMEDVLEQNNLTFEYEVEVQVELDQSVVWLGYDAGPDGMDEGSECEEPYAELHRENEDLRQEATDRQALISAIQDMGAYERVRLDLERARMRLEDRRSHSFKMSSSSVVHVCKSFHGLTHLSTLSIHDYPHDPSQESCAHAH